MQRHETTKILEDLVLFVPRLVDLTHIQTFTLFSRHAWKPSCHRYQSESQISILHSSASSLREKDSHKKHLLLSQ